MESGKRPLSPLDGDTTHNTTTKAPDPPELENFIKISHRDDVNRLGGKLAWDARRDSLRPLLATGAGAIAVALRAIAEARRYLGEDETPVELLVQPAFRDEQMRQALAFYLVRTTTRKTDEEETSAKFTVSKSSTPPAVAGAIAGRARQGVGALITAVGDEALCKAAVAICRARIFLEDDKLDVRFVSWIDKTDKVGLDGEEARLTLIKMRMYVDRYDECS